MCNTYFSSYYYTGTVTAIQVSGLLAMMSCSRTGGPPATPSTARSVRAAALAHAAHAHLAANSILSSASGNMIIDLERQLAATPSCSMRVDGAPRLSELSELGSRATEEDIHAALYARELRALEEAATGAHSSAPAHATAARSSTHAASADGRRLSDAHEEPGWTAQMLESRTDQIRDLHLSATLNAAQFAQVEERAERLLSERDAALNERGAALSALDAETARRVRVEMELGAASEALHAARHERAAAIDAATEAAERKLKAAQQQAAAAKQQAAAAQQQAASATQQAASAQQRAATATREARAARAAAAAELGALIVERDGARLALAAAVASAESSEAAPPSPLPSSLLPPSTLSSSPLPPSRRPRNEVRPVEHETAAQQEAAAVREHALWEAAASREHTLRAAFAAEARRVEALTTAASSGAAALAVEIRVSEDAAARAADEAHAPFLAFVTPDSSHMSHPIVLNSHTACIQFRRPWHAPRRQRRVPPSPLPRRRAGRSRPRSRPLRVRP